MSTHGKTLGATPLADGTTHFRVWAPAHTRVEVCIKGGARERRVALGAAERGYHEGVLDDAPAGTEYCLRLSGGPERPDPASRLQARGVHGPSCVVDPGFAWTDGAWLNPPLARHVIYELHVGTFSPEGTFDGAIARLDDLKELGITALELMPIAEFPGDRNWGYDGVSLYAAHHSYGGPDGLRRLVDACHARGIAVFLDVVYNHLGPEGNYLGEFGGYFTDEYKTPWGRALNFDGPGSDEVRAYFIGNALYWLEACHIDGLRLDAVHAIRDHSARPFLRELGEEVRGLGDRLGRRFELIAESSDNDPRLVRPVGAGGVGMDAVWNDDFHHAVRTLLTGEKDGYYVDYGTLSHLTRTLTDGFGFTGQYSPGRQRRHGMPAPDVAGSAFVVCCQNHDQIGNRMAGDRLGATAGLDGCRVAAGLTILSPFVPMLFMGEEYAEPAPFQYFVSHTDPALVEAVRKGRREEFAAFGWEGEVPDPQSPTTFERCRLDWSLRSRGAHAGMLAYYRELLRLRRETPPLASLDRASVRVVEHSTARALGVFRTSGEDAALLLANFEAAAVEMIVRTEDGEEWERVLDSTDGAWEGTDGRGGAGSSARARISRGVVTLPARSFHVYLRRSH